MPSDARQPSKSGPEVFVAKVGADEWIRYKATMKMHGYTTTCSHFHDTEKAAQTCANKMLATFTKRMERASNLRIKAPE